ncbi:hypothetical protein ACKAV7_003911 [Fusarium commune]
MHDSEHEFAECEEKEALEQTPSDVSGSSDDSANKEVERGDGDSVTNKEEEDEDEDDEEEGEEDEDDNLKE